MRPVARPGPSGEWAIAVHPVGNLSLSFDHRAVDGAYAAAFLAAVREILETRDWSRGARIMTAAAPDPVSNRPDLEGLDGDEVVDDFRTACVSRAIDDGEIRMQKQSRVFFQISGRRPRGAGPGAGPPPPPRPTTGSSPTTATRRSCLGLGVTATEVLLQAVGSADDPSSGGRQMPSHWGNAALNIVTQSSPTGSQCIPAVGCAEASRYIVRRPDLPGCTAYGDELTYVSLGEGACSEGEFWESLNTACTLHLPVLYVVADNGYAISVPGRRPASGAGVRAGPWLPWPRDRPRRRHRLPGRAASGPAR